MKKNAVHAYVACVSFKQQYGVQALAAWQPAMGALVMLDANIPALFAPTGENEQQGRMHNWQDNEIRQLLTIRGSEEIRNQITGTVKDSVVFNRVTKLLADRGVHRSHTQVTRKLKALRKQYMSYRQEETRGGCDRVHWPFYELCRRAFDAPPTGKPLKRHPDPAPPSVSACPSPPPLLLPESPPPPAAPTSGSDEVVVSLWDDEDDKELCRPLAPLEAKDKEEEEEEEYSSSETLHTVTASHPLPKKKRKTMMAQVSALVSATVTQLREMDAAVQAQEDTRLEKLMAHEREMQSSLMSQFVAMQERMSREQHERNLELVDRILSRFPSPESPPSGQ
ncbi:uncharacterized protein KZ484_016599 [Pholidichthys leucotaenia]